MRFRTLFAALTVVAIGLTACEQYGAVEEGTELTPADTGMMGDTAAGENVADGPPPETVFCPVVERRIPKEDCEDLAAIEDQVKEGTGAFNVPDPMTRGEATTVVLVVDRRSPEQIAALEAARNEVSEGGAVENAVDDAAGEASDAPLNGTMSENVADSGAGTSPATNGGPTPSERVEPFEGETPSERVEPFEGETETIIPQVGRFMSADLVGEGFEIEALTSASQEIPPGEHATWQWSVKAIREGVRTLTLKTIVEGVVDGQRYPLARTETTTTVTVEVRAGDRVADWIDATIGWLDRMKLLLLAIAGVIGAAWLVWRNIKGKGEKPDAVE
jgi:hypothetical protein